MFSIISYLRQGEYLAAVISVLSSCFVVFCCLPIHELAHGFAADKLGDHTARNMGRLKFNPIAHLDLLGTVMIFLFGIGYAKPVPVNPRNFKNPKKDIALVSLAGPLSNLVMGFISILFAYFVLIVEAKTASVLILDCIFMFFRFSALVNVCLAVFNLLPIPPLDGSKILGAVLPDKAYAAILSNHRTFQIVMMLLLLLGIFDRPLAWLESAFMKILCFIPELIYNLIV